MSEITSASRKGVPVLGFLIPWMGGLIVSKFPLSPLGLLAGAVVCFITIIAQERACK